MQMNLAGGLYETLITRMLDEKLRTAQDSYYIARQKLDANEAAQYLSRFLSQILLIAFDSFPKNDQRVDQQIKLANDLIKWLADYLKAAEFSENVLDLSGELLTALLQTRNPVATDLAAYVARVTPQTGLVQSELFTGSHVGLSLDAELKREILSADDICWLVSFIKWTGIRIFADALQEAVQKGTRLRVITTTYMGATEQKAIEFLAGLPNTEVRISYNTDRERLHAKSYLFIRNSGFDTGYIGSSNISRSALTNGLEWNLKVTTQEIPHIIEKFKSTFETYWASPEFDRYCPTEPHHKDRLKRALQLERHGEDDGGDSSVYFDLEPHPYQQQILDRLEAERTIHGRTRNLIVAATGTGKTVISAFDFRAFRKKHPAAKLLFVAHREEILKQARAMFRAVLRQNDFGELWVGGSRPEHYQQLFASVQTLNNHIGNLNLDDDYYDFIIVDEVHHIAAASYRPILKQFTPQLLLGLTATPERHDEADILDDFCGVIAAELRLPEAINQRHLCPFQYFGIDDPVDLSQARWEKGRYLPSELTGIYRANDQRVGHIIRAMDKILNNIHTIKALAFCVSQEHAEFMANKFCLKGSKAAVLTSRNAGQRQKLRRELERGDINILCVVDIFNEGVDIPQIDTLLFLRPTESLTIFLQQLGRGLRLAEGKDCLTVLDFVGNSRPEYDFAQKFRSLVGKTHIPILEEVESNFPHLPLGCSITLNKQAKEVILNNIKKAILNKRSLLNRVRNFANHTSLPLTLTNFLRIHPQISLDDIFKLTFDSGGGWTRICIEAGRIQHTVDQRIESALARGFRNRILQCSSRSYLHFLKQLLATGNWNPGSETEQQMARMAYWDFWQKSGHETGFASLGTALQALAEEPALRDEYQEVLDLVLARLDTIEKPMSIPFPSALQLHSRYARDAILAAFGEHTFERKSPSREGVVEIKPLNCELLFVTLQKTERNYSPTTLYHDYAISERLFHWQTQNSARPDRGKGRAYIEQCQNGKTILLFVREANNDALGRSMGFVNLGPVTFVSYHGSQPMNITWRLHEPLPAWLWQEAAKLAVG